MEAISAIAAASGVFLAGLERDQSTEAAASWPEIRAEDPDSFNQDPDPAFQMNPVPDPIRIQGFMTKKWRKKLQQKIC